MKLKLSLSAALLAGVISATAATETSAPKVAGTNADPQAAMTALFGDPVIVKGSGFEIKRSELDEVLAGAKANAASAGQLLPPDFSVGVLNQLITIQLLLQKATDADRAAGKVDADLQFTNLVKRFGSAEAFERQLKAVGMTMDNLRSKAMQEAVAKTVLKRELKIAVSEADAKDYYAKNPADFEQPEMAHVRHILLMTIDPATRTPLSTNAVAAKRKQIESLLKRVNGGEDFAKLAKEFSEDPGSKENGGELPEFPRGQMVPEFEAAAFALTKNQVSDIVASQFGFHIIKGIDKTAAKRIDFAIVAADLKEVLARRQIAKLAPDYVKKLRADSKLEILDPTLKALSEKVEASATAPSESNK
ncbi:MAG: peptidylprolyl isomerase [Verrucomicrobiota bacterium]